MTSPSVQPIPPWKGFLTVADGVPTGLLNIANVQVDRILEEPRRIAASGRLITIEDVAMQQPRGTRHGVYINEQPPRTACNSPQANETAGEGDVTQGRNDVWLQQIPASRGWAA
jgi:hypothetical protein